MEISISFKLSIGRKSIDKPCSAKQQNNLSLVESVRTVAENATRQHSYSTAANYYTAMRSLLRFLKVRDVRLDSLTADMLVGYQRWLLNRGVSLNTVSCYMRSLRAVYNHVSKENTTEFKKVFTGHTRTAKRSLTARDISQLLQLSLPEKSSLAVARDIFLFSFYCHGMPFIDIAFLRKEQLRDGQIQYARHKTGQPIKIAINHHICQIIDRYITNSSPYVFPIITKHHTHEAHQQYEHWLRRYNKALRQLGRAAHIDTLMSSYVARHSWASIAFQNNIDLNIISQAMGHTDTKTTMIYIRELDTARIDRANNIVINALEHPNAENRP